MKFFCNAFTNGNAQRWDSLFSMRWTKLHPVNQKELVSKSEFSADFNTEANEEICAAIRTIQNDRNNLC